MLVLVEVAAQLAQVVLVLDAQLFRQSLGLVDLGELVLFESKERPVDEGLLCPPFG